MKYEEPIIKLVAETEDIIRTSLDETIGDGKSDDF